MASSDELSDGGNESDVSEYQCELDDGEAEDDIDTNDETENEVANGQSTKRKRKSKSNSNIQKKKSTPSPKSNTKKTYDQHFRKDWMDDPRFKDWLAESKSSTNNKARALCTYCNRVMSPKQSVLVKHYESDTHIKNAKPHSDTRQKQTKLDHNYFVTSAERVIESRLALYIAVHCSVLSIDHLTNVCTSLFGSKIHLKRTKCTGIIMNAWYPHFVEKLVSDIGDSKYSLIIDESTDIAVHKMLGIVIRYYSKTTGNIVTSFLTLVQLEAGNADCISSAINTTIVTTFGLRTENCIGLGTDNAAVMTGVNNGVHQKLTEMWSHPIVLVRCICHSMVLAVNSACEELPRNLEFLVRETYNWFSHSTNRRIAYKKIYEAIYDEAPLKITAICETRWLSIYTAIERILVQWEALQSHFDKARADEKCFSAGILYEMYKDTNNYCYFLFLKQVLEPVSRANQCFQSNKDPFKLIDGLLLCINSVAGKVLNPTARVDIFTTQDLRSYVDPKPYFGASCEAKFSIIEKTEDGRKEVAGIRSRCVNFVLKLLDELKSRLPSNYQQLQAMQLLTIENTLKRVKGSLVPLMQLMRVPPSDIDSLESQWNDIIYIKWDQEVVTSKNSLRFWNLVYEYTDASGSNPFMKLADFVLQVLSLPLSNADVERLFSAMNLTKSKTRNRMGLRLLVSILAIKFGLRLTGSCCHDYEVPASVSRVVGTLEAYRKEEGVEILNPSAVEEILEEQDIDDVLPFIIFDN